MTEEISRSLESSQEFRGILKKRKSFSKFSYYDESTRHSVYSVFKEHNYSSLENTTEKDSKNDDDDTDSLPDWLKTVSSSDEESDTMDHVPGLSQLLKLESEKTASPASLINQKNNSVHQTICASNIYSSHKFHNIIDKSFEKNISMTDNYFTSQCKLEDDEVKNNTFFKLQPITEKYFKAVLKEDIDSLENKHPDGSKMIFVRNINEFPCSIGNYWPLNLMVPQQCGPIRFLNPVVQKTLPTAIRSKPFVDFRVYNNLNQQNITTNKSHRNGIYNYLFSTKSDEYQRSA